MVLNAPWSGRSKRSKHNLTLYLQRYMVASLGKLMPTNVGSFREIGRFSKMRKTFRPTGIWCSRLVLAGLVVWLAHGILVDDGTVSDVTYAGPAQRQTDRKTVVIDRPPLRFIKD